MFFFDTYKHLLVSQPYLLGLLSSNTLITKKGEETRCVTKSMFGITKGSLQRVYIGRGDPVNGGEI